MTQFRGQKTRHHRTVSRPVSAETQNAPYLQNCRAYELQTWYTDEVRRPACIVDIVNIVIVIIALSLYTFYPVHTDPVGISRHHAIVCPLLYLFLVYFRPSPKRIYLLK